MVAHAGVEKAQAEKKDGIEELVEQEPRDEQAEHAELSATRPFGEAQGCRFAHHHGDAEVAIQRRHRQEIERSEQEVEHEEDAERRREEVAAAAGEFGDVRDRDVVGWLELPESDASVNRCR